MDMTLIQGTISSLKTAADIAKSLIELKSIGDVQAKVVELQTAILAAQSSALSANANQAAMIDEIRTLKEEIARVKAWEHQKVRYKLTPYGDGASVVYALKESMCEGEPPHWICTKCYEDGKRMILQPNKGKLNIAVLACPECGTEIYSRHRTTGIPEYV